MSVERDPYAFTNGECVDKLEEFLQVAKDRDPVGWPRGILPYIERAVDALRNQPFRGFIADADRSPMRAPNGRNDAGEPADSFWNRRAERAAGGVDEVVLRQLEAWVQCNAEAAKPSLSKADQAWSLGVSKGCEMALNLIRDGAALSPRADAESAGAAA